jgi:hypothetical protein
MPDGRFEEDMSIVQIRRALPVPATLKREVTVKLNAGAILREEKHFRRQTESEAKRLAEVEAGAFDADSFVAWDLAEQAKDEQQRLDQIEVNHLNGLISREEAILAKERTVEEKHMAASEVRADTEAKMRRYLQQQAKTGAHNRQLVLDTALLYDRVYEARTNDAVTKVGAAHL